MGLIVTSAAQEQPITLDEAKNFMRVDHNDQNELIATLIKAATEEFETYTRRALVQRTYEYKIDRFPKGKDPIRLPMPPLASVTKIDYVDTSGNVVTWSAAEYRVETGTQKIPARITPAWGYTYPNIQAVTEAVLIEYVAGYGDREAVPEIAKLAVKYLCQEFFDNPETVIVGTSAMMLPGGLRRLLNSLMVFE